MGVNIKYNRPVGEEELRLFKLIEEFTYTNLKDKSLYYEITLHFNELEDKRVGLTYTGQCFIHKKSKFSPHIKISKYALRLCANSYIRIKHELFDSFEKVRLQVIFHEIAHIIECYNNPNLLELELNIPGLRYTKHEENTANNMSDEFLKSKGLL
jgi:hypothetical protein